MRSWLSGVWERGKTGLSAVEAFLVKFAFSKCAIDAYLLTVENLDILDDAAVFL